MKTKTILSLAAFAGCALISFQGFTFSNGSPANRSGSPASNGATCSTGGCHSGPAVSTETITISTDIPSQGFEENTDYQITITASDGGRNLSKMGFQASVEGNGSAQGTISSIGGDTKLAGANFITHTNAGNSASGGSRIWNFDWNSGSAPDQTTVYAAVNFSNNNGGNSGDVIETMQLVLTKNTIGLTEISPQPEVFLFPNPAVDFIEIETDLPSLKDAKIFDLHGQLCRDLGVLKKDDAGRFLLDVSAFANGVYIFNTHNVTRQFTVSR